MEKYPWKNFTALSEHDAERAAEEAAAWRDLMASSWTGDTKKLKAHWCSELEKKLKGQPVKMTITKPDIDDTLFDYRNIRPIGEPLGFMRRADWVAPKKKNDVTIEVVERKKDVI